MNVVFPEAEGPATSTRRTRWRCSVIASAIGRDLLLVEALGDADHVGDVAGQAQPVQRADVGDAQQLVPLPGFSVTREQLGLGVKWRQVGRVAVAWEPQQQAVLVRHHREAAHPAGRGSDRAVREVDERPALDDGHRRGAMRGEQRELAVLAGCSEHRLGLLERHGPPEKWPVLGADLVHAACERGHRLGRERSRPVPGEEVAPAERLPDHQASLGVQLTCGREQDQRGAASCHVLALARGHPHRLQLDLEPPQGEIQHHETAVDQRGEDVLRHLAELIDEELLHRGSAVHLATLAGEADHDGSHGARTPPHNDCRS